MKNVNNDLNPERFNELLLDVGLGPPFSWNPIGLNNASWKYGPAWQVSTYRWDSYRFNIGKVIIFTAYLILTKIRWRTKPCWSLVWRFFMVNYSCVMIVRFNFSPVARWQICQKCYSGNKYYVPVTQDLSFHLTDFQNYLRHVTCQRYKECHVPVHRFRLSCFFLRHILRSAF